VQDVHTYLLNFVGVTQLMMVARLGIVIAIVQGVTFILELGLLLTALLAFLLINIRYLKSSIIE
jgi:hypothetical protein